MSSGAQDFLGDNRVKSP